MRGTLGVIAVIFAIPLFAEVIICLATLAAAGIGLTLLDRSAMSAGVVVAPSALFVLLCIAFAATLACASLLGPRSAGLRILFLLPPIVAVFTVNELIRAGPSALGVARGRRRDGRTRRENGRSHTIGVDWVDRSGFAQAP